jgi:hypothetical protein
LCFFGNNKTDKRKLSPLRRKFAQSGHPVVGRLKMAQQCGEVSRRFGAKFESLKNENLGQNFDSPNVRFT